MSSENSPQKSSNHAGVTCSIQPHLNSDSEEEHPTPPHSIQFPEDDEHEDLWKTNPLGSGLNETQKSILDDGDDINDVKEIEVVDLTGDEEEDVEPPPPKRPRVEESDLSHATLKRTNTTLSAVSA